MDQSETPFLLFFAETNQRQSCSRVPQSFPSLSSSCAEVLWGRDWCWKGRKGLWPVECNADRVEQFKFVVPFENTFLRRLRAQVHVTLQITRPYFIESWISRTIADISQCTSSIRLNKLSHHSETLLKWANHLQDFVRDTGRKNAIKDGPLEGWGF